MEMEGVSSDVSFPLALTSPARRGVLRWSIFSALMADRLRADARLGGVARGMGGVRRTVEPYRRVGMGARHACALHTFGRRAGGLGSVGGGVARGGGGLRGGKAERAECVVAVEPTFEVEEEKEHKVIKSMLISFAEEWASVGRGVALKLKSLGRAAEVLTTTIRLWFACLPPAVDGPLTSPSFSLLFTQLSEICANYSFSLVAPPNVWAEAHPFLELLAGYVYLGASQTFRMTSGWPRHYRFCPNFFLATS
ncbi:hypothetical protein C8R43DRAFT_1125656 [Mycena crocata]|nr:hypothetical protein C8R43DRAFT_1125656 [Mycena crocata]